MPECSAHDYMTVRAQILASPTISSPETAELSRNAYPRAFSLFSHPFRNTLAQYPQQPLQTWNCVPYLQRSPSTVAWRQCSRKAVCIELSAARCRQKCTHQTQGRTRGAQGECKVCRLHELQVGPRAVGLWEGSSQSIGVQRSAWQKIAGEEERESMAGGQRDSNYASPPPKDDAAPCPPVLMGPHIFVKEFHAEYSGGNVPFKLFDCRYLKW